MARVEEVWLECVNICILGIELKPGGIAAARKACLRESGCRERDVLQDLGKHKGMVYNIKRVTAERIGQAYENLYC